MLLSRPSDSLRQSLTFFLPANFLPVKLSAADIASSSSEVTFSAVDVCGCQDSFCSHLKYAVAACCGYGVNIADSAPCTDQAGGCQTVEDEEFPCTGDYPCQGNVLVSCPTPTPTPDRLWQDVNHNGVSEPGEIHSLPALGVESISLDYRASRKKDRHGNEFRYRAKVNGRGSSDTGKWAYDVFLLSR